MHRDGFNLFLAREFYGRRMINMINFIFYFFIIFCFLILAVIAVHRIPFFAGLSREERMILEKKKGVVQRCLEINYKHYLFNLLVATEKFLRRIKIWFLKIENFLTRCIFCLRKWSEAMAYKSKEWIKQREMKRREKREKKAQILSAEAEKREQMTAGAREEEQESGERGKKEISQRVEKKEKTAILPASERDDGGQSRPLTPLSVSPSEVWRAGERGDGGQTSDISRISFSELKKPIQEEQKWINLIIENPKNITAYKFLGLLYWRQHNCVDAKASLEMAVHLGSKDKKVKEILEEIEKTEKIDKIKEE